jgi:hypothetical protein
MQNVIVFGGLGLAFFLTGLIAGLYLWRQGAIPLAIRKSDWSIGIYVGESPFRLGPDPDVKNPVLTARDVTDVPAVFIADPFMIKEGDTWYMFFELMESGIGRGCVGLATSDDGANWSYQQVVLKEPFHLSYPYVFKWQNEFYMTPESSMANSVRLYKAVDFPAKWVLVETLLDGKDFSDPSPFFYDGKWWIFVGTDVEANDTLHLYYADHLEGPWTQHPTSPVIQGDARIARPAGRVIQHAGRLFRYTQDCSLKYGDQVRSFEILELTPNSYREQEMADNPVLSPSKNGWNAEAMHTVDLHETDRDRWIACVDGYRISFHPRYEKRHWVTA